MNIYEYCIYTIVKESKLDKIYELNEIKEITEKKKWQTGLKLLKDAKENNKKTLILFADATDCTKLLYWGILSDIKISDDKTIYSVEKLQPIKNKSPQDLVLRSTNKNISEGYIRPYAICKTPDFLSKIKN